MRLVWALIPLVLVGIMGMQESFAELNLSNSTDTDEEICGDHLCSEDPFIRYTPHKVGKNTDPKYFQITTTLRDLIEGGVPVNHLWCSVSPFMAELYNLIPLEIMIHDDRTNPICVTAQTSQKLEEREWGMSLKTILNNTENNFGKRLLEPINNFTITYYHGGETKIGPDFKKILDTESDEYYLDAYENNTFWKHWFEQTYPNLTVEQALGIQPWPEVCFDNDICFEGQNNLVQITNEIPISIFKTNSYDDVDLVMSHFNSVCKNQNTDNLDSTFCIFLGGSNIHGINDYSEEHKIKNIIRVTDKNIFQVATISFLEQNETWIILSTIEKSEIGTIEERTIIEKFKKIVNSFTVDGFQHHGI